MVPAESSRMRRPVAVSPVKATLSTPGWAASASPTSLPGPVRTLTTPSGTPASRQISPRITAVIGVALAGLRMRVLPAARAGASFQAAISKREIPGHDLGADADRLAQGVVEQGTVHRDLLAPELRGEPGVVLEAVGGGGDVAARLDDDLAAVGRLHDRDLGQSLAQERRDLVHDARPLQRRHARPRSLVERLARGGDGAIDVLDARLGHAPYWLVRRRADGVERLAADAAGTFSPPMIRS